ncbi:MAG: hypothetical protein Kow001_13680 [Acidobacteriota bacterium]
MAMFQQTTRSPRSSWWKFLPVAVALAAGIAALVVYLGRSGAAPPEELSGVLRAGDPNFEWYSKYVELVSPKIEMGLNFAGNRILILSGVIRNQGEKVLDVVEIKVVFFNYENPVQETVRVPIRPGPYTPPIPPLSDRAFSFYIEKLPEGWLASHAEMSIHGFRFKSGGP